MAGSHNCIEIVKPTNPSVFLEIFIRIKFKYDTLKCIRKKSIIDELPNFIIQSSNIRIITFNIRRYLRVNILI